MARPTSKPDRLGGSFLPEDYIRRKAERRSIMIALGLFSIVVFGVVAAALVTNRQRATIEAQQQQINAEFVSESKKIEQLNVLNAQKAEQIEKAQITTALIEKVPRSILLAELINRMPKQLTLSEFKLESKRIVPKKTPGQDTAAKKKAKPRSLSGKTKDAKGENAEPPKPKVVPPAFEFKVRLVGMASTDAEVADYQASLQKCPLLESVELLYSSEVVIEDLSMRKFLIEASLRPAADARTIEPLHVPRLGTMPGEGFHNSQNAATAGVETKE